MPAMPPTFTPPPTFDLHCDTALEILAGADIPAGNPHGHVDLPRMRAGHMGAQVMAAFVSPLLPPGRAWRRTQDLLDGIDRTCAASGGALRPAESAAEVTAAMAAGAVALVRGVENGHAIEESLSNLEHLRRRGVRLLTLTHSRHLSWISSCSGGAGGPDEGLTAFGREVVHAMNDLGMVVDVSHASEAAFWAVARTSRLPFLASHSCAAALCPSVRNLSDDQLRALADAGGMVGINFFPSFLDAAYGQAMGPDTFAFFSEYEAAELAHMDDPAARMASARATTRRFQAAMASHAIPMERICDHVQHVIDLVGDDCVGFGADLDGVPDLPAGVGGCDIYPAVLATLAERGLSAATLEKLAWRNALRVLAANESR